LANPPPPIVSPIRKPNVFCRRRTKRFAAPRRPRAPVVGAVGITSSGEIF
jgi:hypothetical protein